FEKLVAAGPGDKKVFPIAAAQLSDSVLSERAFGKAADLDKAVALAEQACGVGASQYTRRTLTEALLARAAATIAKEDPQFAALHKTLNHASSAHSPLAHRPVK